MNYNKLSEPGDYYTEVEGEILPPGLDAEPDTTKRDAKERGEIIARAYIEKNNDLTREVLPSVDMNRAYGVSRRLLGLDDHDFYGTSEIPPTTPEAIIANGVTTDKGQVAKEKWYTDKKTKLKKKYTVSVAFIVRTRVGKSFYLESSRTIPETGSSAFLDGEWTELERRIDNGEGKEK